MTENVKDLSSLYYENQQLNEEIKKLRENNLNLNAELFKYNDDDYQYYLTEKNKRQEQIKILKTKISKLYLILPINTTLLILILVLGIWQKSFLTIFLTLMFGTPIFFLSIIVTIIKFHRDIRKLKNWTISKLSRNYIIARFFYPNRKTEEIYFRVTGKELKYSGGLYFITEKAIYFNQDNKPIIDFDINIPNPRIYSNKKVLEKYAKADDKRNVFDENGNIIDLSYSSETIQDFKKDKLFKEFHSSGTQETLGAITILGIIILFVMVMYLIMSR